MPATNKEKDQDQNFYSPDGSHDDLGGLSPAEDAEFNNLASNFKDGEDGSSDNPKAGSDSDAGKSFYAPSSPIGFAKQLILQAGLKRLGIGGGLLGLILTIVAVISVIAPSFFAVHVKEVYTDYFGRETQLTTRRRFRNVKKHFIIKQDDTFEAYKNKGRLMRQIYSWDTTKFNEDMRSKGVVLDTENSKAIGYYLTDSEGRTKHVKLADFPPGRKGIAAFRKQAIADFGFDGLNRTSQQSISEIMDDVYHLDSWALRSNIAKGSFERLRLFRGNPFQNARATQHVETLEAELGRDLTLDEETKAISQGTVSGEIDGNASTIRISPDDAEFDTATEEGKVDADQQSRLNELPNEVTTKADEVRATIRDPANRFEHKADKAVGDVTSETLEQAAQESLSFGGLVRKAGDPTIEAADYACRIKLLLTGAIISGMLIRTGVLMELANLVFNVGDSQKAGMISPHVLGAFTAMITSVDSQGRSFNDSPGYHKVIGNPSAKSLSPQGLALFGANRTLPQPFGSVLGFLNNTPGINSQKVCSVVTNTIFNIGASTAILALTVFTGGGVAAFKTIGWSVFLKTLVRGVGVGLTIEALFQLTLFFAMPIIVEAAAGAVFTFDEGGFLSAEAITIGSSLLFGHLARSNLGARAVTNGQLAAIHQEIEADRAVELAQMSWYDRWISPDNHRSLTAKVLVNSPMSVDDGLARAKFAMINLFNPFQSGVAQGLAKQASALTPSAYAEDDLARDIAGNPVMATPPDELNKIDPIENIKFMLDNGFIKDIASTGDPTADSEAEMETEADFLEDPYKGGITYAKYAELCFTSSVEVDPAFPDASPDKIVGYGNEKCSSPGPVAEGDVPLDENGEVDVDNGTVSKPGLYERFRAYRTDSFLIASFSESVSRDFGGSTVSTATPASSATAGVQIEGDPYTDSESVACAAGTNDLGLAEGYSDGKKINLRLCSLPNLPSSGQADNTGGRFSTPGASGLAIVNSRVSGAWFALVNDMKAAGLNPTAFSSYRSMAHQQANCTKRSGCADGDYSLVAQPGYSSHQAGVAIDFDIPRQKGGTTCATRATLPNNAIWAWLNENSEKYGFKQYAYEAWHWDAYPAADRCGKV